MCPVYSVNDVTGLPERSGTPPGCDLINFAFPVVSADSDHRLLSLQPFGLRWVSQLHCPTDSKIAKSPKLSNFLMIPMKNSGTRSR